MVNIKRLYSAYISTYYHPHVSHSKQHERCLKQLYFVIHTENSAIHCPLIRDPEIFIYPLVISRSS